MAIQLAHNDIGEELDDEMRQLYNRAYHSQRAESNPPRIIAGLQVQAKIVREPVGGKNGAHFALKRIWLLNGHRIGRNALAGKLRKALKG